MYKVLHMALLYSYTYAYTCIVKYVVHVYAFNAMNYLLDYLISECFWQPQSDSSVYKYNQHDNYKKSAHEQYHS